MQFSSLFPR